jgi:gluconolactonase
MTVPRAQLSAANLGFPEGPLVLPDGRIAFVEEYLGRVSVTDGTAVEPLAVLGGNPNGLALGGDGRIYVTRGAGMAGGQPATPAIVRIDPDNRESAVLTTTASGRLLRAPNDLCFGPDGALYFTDPGPFNPDDDALRGWICRLDDAGCEILFDLPNVHPNGIAFSPRDTLVWVESVTGHVVEVLGGVPAVIARLGEASLPDGCAFATNGSLLVATFRSGGIHIVDWPDGRARARLRRWSADVCATNVAFDGSAVWVTDASLPPHVISNLSGRLWRLETQLNGLRLHGWATPGAPGVEGGVKTVN